MFDLHKMNSLDDSFNIIPIPLLLVTKAGLRIVRLNHAAAGLLNITENVALKKRLADFFETEHKDYISWMNRLQNDDISVTKLPMRLNEQQTIVLVYTAYTDFAGAPHLLLSLVDITGKCRRIKQLEQLAAKDDMTGLLNRRAFRESLELTLQKARQEESSFFLAFMDLDGLKKVNDAYGHREGDWYIRMFTSLLRQTLRKTDIAGRVGGDEFATILTQCSRQSAEKTILRLQQKVRTISISLDKPYTTGVSIGLIAIESWMETDADSLLSIADDAMYKQKYNRKKVRIFDKNKHRW